MSFRLSPIAFTNDVTAAINLIRLSLLGRSGIPSTLYHYTSFENVLKICQSRVLWATSAADLNDVKEIQYGTDLLEEEVQRYLQSGRNEFVRMVLNYLSPALVDNKYWTFVACFCDTPHSSFHRNQFKSEYCLGFETHSNTHPRLRPRAFDADVQYHRVSYRPCIQRGALRKAIDEIAESAKKHALGAERGPWLESIAQFCARNASQLLMDLVASFKSTNFRREREWRVVCRPALSLNSSAPDTGRDMFKHLIRTREDGKHYVELQTAAPHLGQVIDPYPELAVPFVSVHRGDGFRATDDELRRLQQILEATDGRHI